MGFICPRCKTDFGHNKKEFDEHILNCNGKKEKPKGNDTFNMTCGNCGAKSSLFIDRNGVFKQTVNNYQIGIDFDGSIVIRCLKCGNEIRFDAGSYEGAIE
jgi:RNase P subunit RPR2